MNETFQRYSVVTGFSFLIILLVVNAVITRRQVAKVVDNQSWVEQSRQIRLTLSQTELLITDAETGQRGFLFTDEARYLGPYEAAAGQVDSHINRLDELTRNDPAQRAHLADLRNLAHQKLEELAETIALYRTGKRAQARSLVLSDRGLLIMTGIRHEIEVMEQEETSREGERIAAYQQSVEGAIAAVYLATAIAVLGLLALARLIVLERKEREENARLVREREEWFRVTLTSIGDAVIATDARGIVTFLNPVAEKLTGIGLDQARGKAVEDVFPIRNEFSGRKAENPVQQVMRSGIVVGLANHTVLLNRGGRLVPIEDSAAPIRDDRKETIGVVLVFRDVSAERASQEMIRKTEKLATAARLSATVAHEINNPLESVVNLLFIAKTSPDATPELLANLTLAEQELERVAHITRQTLGFYRESNTPERVEIPAIVDPILKMYSNRINSKAIQFEFAANHCPPVLGVAGELRQAIGNLIANAIDAVPRSGRIAVRCASADTAEGKNAEIVVSDNGPGIAPDLLEKIFDPFFTTKRDVGTGLGLWVAKEIIHRHGGSIEVQPGPGPDGARGAAFLIRLPVAPADEEQSAQER
jgi:PAS domain S-box-containing protein